MNRISVCINSKYVLLFAVLKIINLLDFTNAFIIKSRSSYCLP